MNPRYFFSLFLCACIALLILAGGLVTSHQAGLAVPDWPLSYGQLMPPMVGNIFWEHGHRMIAGCTGILTLIIAVWTQLQEKRRWFKKLAWISFGAVVLQALLGGLTVLLMLPPPVSIFHACLAQTFFCLAVWMAYGLSPYYDDRREPCSRTTRLAIITTVLIYLQLILGAVVRHTHHGIEAHVVVGILALIHLYLIANLLLHEAGSDILLSRAALALAVLGLVQPVLGVGSWIQAHWLPQQTAPSLVRVIFTAAHQTTGAWILALSFLVTLRVCKK